jgi:hypothetical protein
MAVSDFAQRRVTCITADTSFKSAEYDRGEECRRRHPPRWDSTFSWYDGNVVWKSWSKLYHLFLLTAVIPPMYLGRQSGWVPFSHLAATCAVDAHLTD